MCVCAVGCAVTVFLLKIRHANNDIARASLNIQRLIFNIQSECTFYSHLQHNYRLFSVKGAE